MAIESNRIYVTFVMIYFQKLLQIAVVDSEMML
jgi:hypothetical protein